MKNLDKQRKRSPEQDSSGSNSSQDQRRRTKLQPVGKQKYKPKQVFLDDEDDVEIDLFGYLEDEEDYEDDDYEDDDVE